MEKRWWLIEHPTRGVLVDIDADGKAHFNWSKPRGHKDHWLFPEKGAAEYVLAKQVPRNVKDKCVVFGPIAQHKERV